MPEVIVRRAGELAGVMRTMKVRVDAEVLKVSANGDARCHVSAGPVVVQASMDWARSPVVHATLGEDDDLHLRTRFSRNFLLVFLVPRRGVRLEIDRAASSPRIAASVEPAPRRVGDVLSPVLTVAFFVVLVCVYALI